jgi:hypothetical protein
MPTRSRQNLHTFAGDERDELADTLLHAFFGLFGYFGIFW